MSHPAQGKVSAPVRPRPHRAVVITFTAGYQRSPRFGGKRERLPSRVRRELLGVRPDRRTHRTRGGRQVDCTSPPVRSDGPTSRDRLRRSSTLGSDAGQGPGRSRGCVDRMADGSRTRPGPRSGRERKGAGNRRPGAGFISSEQCTAEDHRTTLLPQHCCRGCHRGVDALRTRYARAGNALAGKCSSYRQADLGECRHRSGAQAPGGRGRPAGIRCLLPATEAPRRPRGRAHTPDGRGSSWADLDRATGGHGAHRRTSWP